MFTASSSKHQHILNSRQTNLNSPIYIRTWRKTDNAVVFTLSDFSVHGYFQDTQEVFIDKTNRLVSYNKRSKHRNIVTLTNA